MKRGGPRKEEEASSFFIKKVAQFNEISGGQGNERARACSVCDRSIQLWTNSFGRKAYLCNPAAVERTECGVLRELYAGAWDSA
jgi:hypothetical protein